MIVFEQISLVTGTRLALEQWYMSMGKCSVVGWIQPLSWSASVE
jgi:hypothetical protein